MLELLMDNIMRFAVVPVGGHYYLRLSLAQPNWERDYNRRFAVFYSCSWDYWEPIDVDGLSYLKTQLARPN